MLITLKIALLKSRRSQSWLAGSTGISAPRLSRLVHGRTRVRASERRKIARALGLPPSDLFPQFRRVRRRITTFHR